MLRLTLDLQCSPQCIWVSAFLCLFQICKQGTIVSLQADSSIEKCISSSTSARMMTPQARQRSLSIYCIRIWPLLMVDPHFISRLSFMYQVLYCLDFFFLLLQLTFPKLAAHVYTYLRVLLFFTFIIVFQYQNSFFHSFFQTLFPHLSLNYRYFMFLESHLRSPQQHVCILERQNCPRGQCLVYSFAFYVRKYY